MKRHDRVCIQRKYTHEMQGDYMHHLKSMNLISCISSLITTRNDRVKEWGLLSNNSFWFSKKANQGKADFLLYDS